MNRRGWNLAIALVVSAAAVCLPTAVAASADYSEGMKLYAAKNYHAAAQKFEAAMKASPSDANIIYYCALSNQMSNNRARARQLYEYIATSFPATRVAAMANDALKALGGGSAGSISSSVVPSHGVTSASSGNRRQLDINLSALPPEVRVPYTERNGGAYLDGQLNGRTVRFHLDTGAPGIVIGANQLADMGISKTAGRNRFESRGVGENIQKAWVNVFDVRVGQIQIRDCPVVVQEYFEGEPLLGQIFLSNFDTIIDRNQGQVIFKKRGSGGASAVLPSGTIDIPFVSTRSGHLVVQVEVNNHPIEMYFDTGADSVCLNFDQLKKLHIDLPDGPPTGISHGVAGQTNTWAMTVNRIKVGKLSQDNFVINVVERSDMDRPLLGQSFYKGYQTLIDQEKKVIHLVPN